ncbi:heparinase [Paenibacillus mesophilus]|nr:heparinase [Paenibacillus mesophilus]
MLVERFAASSFSGKLIPSGRFTPFPKIENRSEWVSIPEREQSYWLAEGEKHLSFEWPVLPAVRYMDFITNGNRSRYEHIYFERRRALASLVLAECIQDSGRFLDLIINGIWAICEESSWVFPAHLHISSKSRGDSLPDVTDPVIDLFAAETAGLLSWTCYLLKTRIDAVSPMVCKRIRFEVKRRILDPYLSRSDFRWMGLVADSRVNNWNPWCNSNCLSALLLLEEDVDVRTEGVRKAMRSLDRFLSVYHEDGGCDEGPSYWNVAGGSLFDCLELLFLASDGAITLYEEPIIGEIGRYIYRAHIGGSYFVNFGDGDALLTPSSDLIYRYGKRIRDPKMIAMGAGTYKGPSDSSSWIAMFRTLSAIFNAATIGAEHQAPPLVKEVWLPQTEFMAARVQEGSEQGLFLAAKGGHNGESHNHNDVGHFMVYANGHPVLVDVGVEQYTAKTFSPQRYDIWTMHSGTHHLPEIDGIRQEAGSRFKATEVQFRSDDCTTQLTLNIADTYPQSASIRHWYREFILNRNAGASITITDQFDLTKAADTIVMNLMTPCRPEFPESGAILFPVGDGTHVRMSYPSEILGATFAKVDITDSRLRKSWGQSLYKITLSSKGPLSEGKWTLAFEQSPVLT